LESAAGNSLNIPVDSLLLSTAVLNFKQLGITPGSSEDEMSTEVKLLLASMHDTNSVINDPETIDELSQYSEDEDSLDDLEKIAVKQLCGDLLEELYDDDSYQQSGDKRCSMNTNKSSAKPHFRKTCKVKVGKHAKMVSK